ncbi:hypothetical protein F4678DRAFT_465965 [Xylaria arbuscula]|nr:hypothetical protein F4678DRAFT_465965 [Xylaria arbuscula]
MFSIFRAAVLLTQAVVQVEFLNLLSAWNSPLSMISQFICEDDRARRYLMDKPLAIEMATTTTTITAATATETTTETATTTVTIYSTPQFHDLEEEEDDHTPSFDVPDCDFALLSMGALLLKPPLNISDSIDLEYWEPVARQTREIERLVKANRDWVLGELDWDALKSLYDEIERMVVAPLQLSCTTLRRLQRRLVELGVSEYVDGEKMPQARRETLIHEVLEEAVMDLTRFTRFQMMTARIPAWAREAEELRSENCPNQDCFKIGTIPIDIFAHQIPQNLLTRVQRLQKDLRPFWQEKTNPVSAWFGRWYERQIEPLVKQWEPQLESWSAQTRKGLDWLEGVRERYGKESNDGASEKTSSWEAEEKEGEEGEGLFVSMEKIPQLLFRIIWEVVFEPVYRIVVAALVSMEFTFGDIWQGYREMKAGTIGFLFAWFVIMTVILTVITLLVERQASRDLFDFGTAVRGYNREAPEAFGIGPDRDSDFEDI